MWLGLELSQIRVGLEPDYVVKIRAGSDYGLGLGQIIGLGLGLGQIIGLGLGLGIRIRVRVRD